MSVNAMKVRWGTSSDELAMKKSKGPELGYWVMPAHGEIRDLTNKVHALDVLPSPARFRTVPRANSKVS